MRREISKKLVVMVVAALLIMAGGVGIGSAQITVTELTQLTDTPYNEWNPSWSPDGAQIAFNSDKDYSSSGQVWVMNADGSGQTQLTFDTNHNTLPAWSPDGQYIAFASERSGNWDIWVMDADGSNAIQLTSHTANDMYPAWSPDGQYIAFASERSGNWDIWVMELGETDKLAITVTEVSDGVIVETSRVKYHLANGGFARELWVDYDGDGTYDEDLSFYISPCQRPDPKYEVGFGNWNIVLQNGGVTGGSICNGTYSREILGILDDKAVVEFTSEFSDVTAKTRWEVYPNGDARVIPYTMDPMEDTYTLSFNWYVSPHKNDIVGMRLSPDVEETATVTFEGEVYAIATPAESHPRMIRLSADFSDISYSHPYQFYQDMADEYTCLIVEPKATQEEDWEWIECPQANDAIWGGTLSKQIFADPSNPIYYSAQIVDWAWYSDPTAEGGGTSEPCEAPTTQPINLDKKFSFFVHWMWGDTNETERYEAAGEIAEMLAGGYPVHNLNTGKDYITIQAAIDDPETLDGHTISVESGIYPEHLVIDKQITLRGDGYPTIDGE
jgi:hypothetical protein